jgi:hypothetical protein
MIRVTLLSALQNSFPTSASMLVQKSLPVRERLQHGFRPDWQMTDACARDAAKIAFPIAGAPRSLLAHQGQPALPFLGETRPRPRVRRLCAATYRYQGLYSAAGLSRTQIVIQGHAQPAQCEPSSANFLLRR